MSKEKKEGRWSNAEVDSTIAVVGVFLAFSFIIGTIMTLVLRNQEVSPDIIIVFQGVKELVLIILAYFFGRAKKQQAEAETNQSDKENTT